MGLGVAMLVMLVLFGSFVAMLVPMVTVLVAIAAGISVNSMVTHVLSQNTATLAIALMIALGVGIDYALFMVSKFRALLADGRPPDEAAVAAVDTSGRAVVLAGGIVVVALLLMLVFGVNITTGIAVGSAVEVAFTIAAALTLLAAALAAGWIRTTVVSSSGYTSAMAQLVEDPSVRTAIRGLVHAEVATLVEHVIDDVTPPVTEFLAGPLGERAAGLVDSLVEGFLASPDLQRRWTEANAAAHLQLLDVLEGDGRAITTAGDVVVLDLAPLLSAAVAFAADRLGEQLGISVDPPVIDAVLDPACELVAGRIPVELAADCGRIPLFPASTLSDARLGFRILRDGTLALLLLPALAACGALMAVPRLRTVVQLGVAGAATALAALAAAAWLRTSLGARTSRFQPVVDAIIEALTNDLRLHVQTCVGASLALALVGVVVGAWRRREA